MFAVSELFVAVSGVRNNLLIDLLRNDIFKIDEDDFKIVSALINDKFFNQEDVDPDLFNFLKNQGVIFEMPEELMEFFPNRLNVFETPFNIEYLVVEYGGLFDISKMFEICSDLRIPFLIIKTDVNCLDQISVLLQNSSFPSSVNIETNNKDLIKNKGVYRVLINSLDKGDFVTVDSIFANQLLYSESLSKNTYLNRKIFISNEGDIKNSPECEDVFGNLVDIKQSEDILEISKSARFQKKWSVTKDDIDVCKDCEFRYCCVDNRIPLQRKSDNGWYHLKECNYNPYIASWKGEPDYMNLEDIGVFSNSLGFKILPEQR